MTPSSKNPQDVIPDELPAEFDSDASLHAPRGRGRRRILRLSAIPTALTVGNLVCGVLAISYVGDAQAAFAAGGVVRGDELLVMAGWVILAGMIFDGVDGSVARLVRSTSGFGGALDSLADMVTFGVAPAFAAKVMMEGSLEFTTTRTTFLTAAFFAACACLRLARFNAEHDEPDAAVDEFSGLPTPGAAGVLAGAAIVHRDLLEWWQPEAGSRLALAYLVSFGALTGLGLLMVSRVPFAHVVNKLLRGRKPVGRVALLLCVVMLLLQFDAGWVLAGGFALYALSGPLTVLPRLLRRNSAKEIGELFD